MLPSWLGRPLDSAAEMAAEMAAAGADVEGAEVSVAPYV